MPYRRKEINKNALIIPVLALIVAAAAYVTVSLSAMVKPMTLDEYEQRYPTPKIPQPFSTP